MLSVVDCFARAHDLWLVALAAGISILASMTAVELLHHARKAAGRLCAVWLGVAAVAGGSGIWATHFVAMLAYEPGLPTGYDVTLTALSLVYAVVLTGAGMTVALVPTVPRAPMVGGAILGSGIAAMHYTGMAAYEIAGRIVWDPALVAASVVIGLVFSSAAVQLAMRDRGLDRRMAGLFLLLGICGHHFTAMGAVTILSDPRIVLSEGAIHPRWLAGGVALMSATLLLFACAALALDIRDRRHTVLERESARLLSLSNVAVEGLLICCGDRIVSANDSFHAIVGGEACRFAGQSLSRFLPDAGRHRAGRGEGPHDPVRFETDLIQAGGNPIPVEVVMRSVTYGREPHYGVAVRDLRAHREAQHRIWFMAHHDGLTGLANRMSFTRRLEQQMTQADAQGRMLAILYLDLDRFKEVNDLFGHAAGDAMLMTVTRAISDLLDETHLMARLGGDEFAILMPCDRASEAGALAGRIQDTLLQERTETSSAIGTSIGIALYPDHATDPALLLNYADTALYRAKSEGRGTFRFFETAMGAEMRDRRRMEHDLRRAVEQGEMRLVFQPQTLVATGKVIGFEALLRWQHPERGAVSPAEFIPVAEETGAILQIGAWVLREACREAASWTNPLTIAVNVSAVQIHAPHFVQGVRDVLDETGLGAERLEIEITETALIRDPARAAATLDQLKAIGVQLAMDDFGTGYSSLSNLRSYPFDKIKIDGSFVRSVDTNRQTAAIVRAMLDLGRGLDLPVLAEGVETEAELRFLAGEDCHAAQGYLIGRPAPIAAFAGDIHDTGRRTARARSSAVPAGGPREARGVLVGARTGLVDRRGPAVGGRAASGGTGA